MIERDALFSTDRQYRYILWRHWDMFNERYVMFIGLNPSTADETNDDPTIRRCIKFAQDWGYGAICMTNLFAFRATDPKVMKCANDPVGPANDDILIKSANKASAIIAAWGVHGSHLGRDKKIMRMIPFIGCLGVTKDGFPRHPLYLPKTTKPQDFKL